MTNNDYTQILRYDRTVLNSKTFTTSERWAISQARSISMAEHSDGRKNYITKQTLEKCQQILKRCYNE